MSKSAVQKKKHRELAKERNRRYVSQYKEYHKCAKCGEGRAVCLDLHHTAPTTKLFEFNKAYKRSIRSIEAELKKCIVVCANCHRLIHAEQEFAKQTERNEIDEEKSLFE